jgi:hypothetical protein
VAKSNGDKRERKFEKAMLKSEKEERKILNKLVKSDKAVHKKLKGKSNGKKY